MSDGEPASRETAQTTEMVLRNGQALTIDKSIDELAVLVTIAAEKKIMLNVFDMFSKKRFAFFHDAILFMSEKKEP